MGLSWLLTAAEVPHRAAVELGWQQVLKQRCSKIAEVLKQRRHGVLGVCFAAATLPSAWRLSGHLVMGAAAGIAVGYFAG